MKKKQTETTDKGRLDVGEAIRGLVLVKLRIGGWSGNVTDKPLAAQLEETHKGADGAFKVRVEYLPKASKMAMDTAATRLRTFWYTQTAPFEDGGWRVVTAEGFVGLYDRLAPFVAEYRAAADEIVQHRDEYKEQARQKLGDAFRDEAFPTVEYLRELFDVKLEERPVVVDAKIVGLSSALNEEMSDRVYRTAHRQVIDAMMSVGRRIADMIETIQSKMAAVEGGKDIRLKRFAEAADLAIEGIRRANLLRDPALDMLTERTGSLVKTMREAADTLKDSDATRTHIKTEAETIQTDLNDLLAGVAKEA